MMVPQILSNGFIFPSPVPFKVAVFYPVFQQNLRGEASVAFQLPPDAAAVAGFVDGAQTLAMGIEFLAAGADDA